MCVYVEGGSVRGVLFSVVHKYIGHTQKALVYGYIQYVQYVFIE